MKRRTLPIVVLACTFVFVPSLFATNAAENMAAQEVPRAIRRDVPYTAAFRRALAAGTRDLTGRPGPNYWQLQTDYTINVTLDPATQTITGSETIVLHNNSPQALNDIYLRLDHNIFRQRALYAAPWQPGEITDGMVLTKLVVNGDAVDLTGAGGAGAGGGGGRGGAGQRRLSVSGLDRTIARISLATPIPARTPANIQIDWRTKIPGPNTNASAGGPGNGHRMIQRFEDRLFQPTQWYPRIAKYDDLRGWETNPYLGPSEFYNNFGRFDVRIDVPGGWIVSGTGVLMNPQQVLTPQARERLARVPESDAVVTIVGDDEVGPGQATAAGDRLVWHFSADQVNDFAWATARKFTWKATRATVPGKGAIPIHMVHLPERAQLFTNAGAVARHAIEFYSKLIAPYPFPQLTLQDGPSAGMEYPMVINSNQGAADHETAHQWWPMWVGTNETWYGWMDEGFNEYMNILSAADSRKTKPALDGEGLSYGQISGREDEPPMMWNANFAGPMYSFTTYSKTPMMLSMLGAMVGDDAVQRALSNFAKTWAFKHPSPWDFVHFMNAELKQDLNWFWNAWMWTTESVDGKIESVTQSGAQTKVIVRQDGQMPAPIVLRVKLAEQGPPIKLAKEVMSGGISGLVVLDGPTALVSLPVDVWFDGKRRVEVTLDFGGRAVTSVKLDPNCRFPDRDPADNDWPRPAKPLPLQTMLAACGQ